jgi:hypothetical protein
MRLKSSPTQENNPQPLKNIFKTKNNFKTLFFQRYHSLKNQETPTKGETFAKYHGSPCNNHFNLKSILKHSFFKIAPNEAPSPTRPTRWHYQSQG